MAISDLKERSTAIWVCFHLLPQTINFICVVYTNFGCAILNLIQECLDLFADSSGHLGSGHKYRLGPTWTNLCK